jgi:hypothetical protein
LRGSLCPVNIGMTNTYQTTDIILAATLLVSGYQLLTVTVQGKRGTFWFQDVDDAFLTQFDLGRAIVEPVAFNNGVKRLTTSIRRLQQ